MQEQGDIVKNDQKLEAYADRLWESVETHQLSDAAVAALSDLVVDCTSTGIILRANAAFCEFTGLDLSEIEGRDGHEFAFMQDRDLPRCTVELCCPKGKKTWYDRLQLSMRDPNTGNHFIRVVGRDITQHKLSELALIKARLRAEEADAAKSRFLAMVSHEIRTPLNGIIGMGKLMSDTKLSPEQQNYVEAISTSSEALLVLVNDLLQFGRNELTQEKLSNEATDPRALFAGVMELLAEKAHSKQLDLGYFVDDNVPAKICIDAGRLRQLLFNVVGNAVKFTADGGVRIDARFENEALLIDVMDSGDGIAEADQAKIFEPFEQVENTFTRSHDGAGLGLAISKRMAEAMGGDIRLSSKIGIGSTFQISVAAQTLEPFEKTDIDLSHERIYVVAKPGVETDILSELIASLGGDVERCEPENFNPKKVADATMIVVDSRLKIDEDTLLKFSATDTKLIALISPNERGTIGARFQAAGHAFLTRPLRQATCMRVLGAGTKAARDAKPVKKSETKSRPTNVARSVLLAEDNAINALLATRMLETNGCSVTHVENGKAAIDAAEAAHFDVILMDYHMPIMDGIDAIKTIRKAEDETGKTNVPIFMVTADNSLDVEKLALDAGASGILQKPLVVDALETALAEMKQFAA